jgi:hypothetical protein
MNDYAKKRKKANEEEEQEKIKLFGKKMYENLKNNEEKLKKKQNSEISRNRDVKRKKVVKPNSSNSLSKFFENKPSNHHQQDIPTSKFSDLVLYPTHSKELIKRLYDQDIYKRKVNLDKLVQDFNEFENKKTTFFPSITQKGFRSSGKLLSKEEMSLYLEEIRRIDDEKEIEIKKKIKEREENELKECTFQPVINKTPTYITNYVSLLT